VARLFILIAALWTLMLSAPLCISGVAAHSCETCAKACSHEASCSQDPCSLKVSQTDTSKTLSSHIHFNAIPLLHTGLPPVALAFSLHEKALTDAALFSRGEQPYPMGAFPLLI
jgi:hypothetical protein